MKNDRPDTSKMKIFPANAANRVNREGSALAPGTILVTRRAY